MDNKKIKDFYSGYSDKIIKKRLRSPYCLRKYAHEQQYKSILNFVDPGMKVLDAGCGEGVLSVMMAQKGAIVTGCDLSEPNINAAKKYASENNLEIGFIVGDAENMPFDNDTFDLVVSSHVLEHLPSFDKGLIEVMRVTKKRAVVAIPTILNLCSLVQVGGGAFWIKRPKSFLKFFVGLLKMLYALIFFKDGVDETYAGHGVPHIFRFPRIMKDKIGKHNFNLIKYEAASICLPYFEFLLPVTKKIDKYKDKKFIRNFGYGTTFVIEKSVKN